MANQNIKFIKDENCYWATKNDETITIINIHYNFYNNKYFYKIGDKVFKRVNDAKRYIRENF